MQRDRDAFGGVDVIVRAPQMGELVQHDRVDVPGAEAPRAIARASEMQSRTSRPPLTATDQRGKPARYATESGSASRLSDSKCSKLAARRTSASPAPPSQSATMTSTAQRGSDMFERMKKGRADEASAVILGACATSANCSTGRPIWILGEGGCRAGTYECAPFGSSASFATPP